MGIEGGSKKAPDRKEIEKLLIELQRRVAAVAGELKNLKSEIRCLYDRLGVLRADVQRSSIEFEEDETCSPFVRELQKRLENTRPGNRPLEFTPETWEKIEAILFTGLTEESELKRTSIAMLGLFLMNSASKSANELSKEDFINHTGYESRAIVNYYRELKRALSFGKMNLTSSGVSFFLENRREEHYALRGKTGQSVDALIQEIAVNKGYNPQLSPTHVSVLLRRGFAHLVEKKALGAKSISFRELALAAEPTLVNDEARESQLALKFHSLLPTHWGMTVDYSMGILRFGAVPRL